MILVVHCWVQHASAAAATRASTTSPRSVFGIERHLVSSLEFRSQPRPEVYFLHGREGRMYQLGTKYERYFSWLATLPLSYWLLQTDLAYTECSNITSIQSWFKTPPSSPVLHTKTTISSCSFESRLKDLCQRIETRYFDPETTGCCGGTSSAGFDGSHHSGSGLHIYVWSHIFDVMV